MALGRKVGGGSSAFQEAIGAGGGGMATQKRLAKVNASQNPAGTGFPNLTDLAKSFGLSGAGNGILPRSGGPGTRPNQQGGAGNTTPGGGQGGSAPPNFSVTAAQNPQLQALAGKFAQYGSELAAGNDQDATLAMQRQRDAISGMAKEFGESAATRGMFGSGEAQKDLLNKVVNPGQASLEQLNANLTSDARKQRLGVLGGEAGVAGQGAAWQQAQQQLGLDTWRAQQQNELSRAQLNASMQNQQMNQMLALMSTIGNLYSGF